MNPEQVANNWIVWLKALASGKYKKTFSSLHNKVKGVERHCCLGVAQICLGLRRNGGGVAVDHRLVELLGLHAANGHAENGEGGSITWANDTSYRDDDDFLNMHKYLIEHLEWFTTPEAAVLIREKLAAQ